MPSLHERIRFVQNSVGAVPGPFDCFLVHRGIRTLALRVARHTENGRAVSEWLRGADGVADVRWPGFGGMVSFRHSDAVALAGRTELFSLAESLGGVESLIEVPQAMTHQSVEDSAAAVPADLVRLSCGIEAPEDLIADLEQALARGETRIRLQSISGADRAARADRCRGREHARAPAGRACGQRHRVGAVPAASRTARTPGLGPEAPEAVLLGLRRSLLGHGVGPERPPDQIQQRGDRDLQDHHQEEDREEAVHVSPVPQPGVYPSRAQLRRASVWASVIPMCDSVGTSSVGAARADAHA